jgi:uncharacterized protein (TIGR02466 family)
MPTQKLFPTHLYNEKLARGPVAARLQRELLKESYQIRDYDKAGRAWCKENYPGGYTSYGTLSQLHRFSSTFDDLRKKIDLHVQRFAKSLDMDLKNHSLEMVSLWLNIQPQGAYHTLHLHPVSAISGTFYIEIPQNSGALKFEDPRMTCFMGSVPRKEKASVENRRFIRLTPQNGQLVLFESWLRHEVEQNRSPKDRISISFNYNWY